jgi:hypothetical protein
MAFYVLRRGVEFSSIIEMAVFFAIRHARGEPLICPYILLTPLTTVSIVPYLPLF